MPMQVAQRPHLFSTQSLVDLNMFNKNAWVPMRSTSDISIELFKWLQSISTYNPWIATYKNHLIKEFIDALQEKRAP